MLITMTGIARLQALRQELQEDAGEDFPHDVLTELLILYDVCKRLELNIFQAREVIGVVAWKHITNYLNSPACSSVNWENVNYSLDASVIT